MIRKVLVLIAVLVSTISFAHEANYPIDNEIVDKIEANKNACVRGYSEDQKQEQEREKERGKEERKREKRKK